MPSYHRPETLSQALALRAEAKPTILAGGTDIYPVRTHRTAWFESRQEDFLDLGGVAELAGIAHGVNGTRIGAMTTWSDIAEAELPLCFAGLKLACRQVGGLQIQNRGTIGGNLCNASPAADGVPPLLALDAQVDLAGPSGRRRMPLAEFVLGNRRTALAPDEILTDILIPPQPDAMRATFLKLGARAYLVISIASVAVNLALDGQDRLTAVRIAIGACSAAPQRLPELEGRLLGKALSPALVQTVCSADFAGLTPIDDVRASAAYRRDAARVLLRRALAELASSPQEAAA